MSIGILVGGSVLLTGAIYVATIFDNGAAPDVSRVVMTNEEFEAVASGATRTEIERRHGAGSENGQEIPEPRGLRCAYYDPRRASGVDAFQLCYDGDRLRQKHQVDVAGSGGAGGFD